MNNRYYEIFQIKIDKFISEIARSGVLYENLSKKNKLLHPGEYGMYKERSLQELLDFIIPYKYEITNGFIINSYNETSTQCDVIIFDKINTPLIEFGNRFQFIPSECVAAIGEVKSKVSKEEFFKTLVKLAEIKKLCKPSQEFLKFNPEYPRERFAPFLFLICDEIYGINDKFTFTDLVRQAAIVFAQKTVDINDFFNIVVSIKQNTAIGYRTSFENEHVSLDTKIYKPIWQGTPMNGSVTNCMDQYTLFREFATALSNSLKERDTFYPDPIDYLW